jgi:hypothetical protein
MPSRMGGMAAFPPTGGWLRGRNDSDNMGGFHFISKNFSGILMESWI